MIAQENLMANSYTKIFVYRVLIPDKADGL